MPMPSALVVPVVVALAAGSAVGLAQPGDAAVSREVSAAEQAKPDGLAVSRDVQERADRFLTVRMNATDPSDPALTEAAGSALTGLDISELTAGEIDVMMMVLAEQPDAMAQARERLGELIDDETPGGAVAMANDILAALISPAQPMDIAEKSAERLDVLLSHEGLEPALRAGRGTVAMTLFTRAVQPQWMMERRDRLAELSDVFDRDAPPTLAMAGMMFHQGMARVLQDQPETAETIRAAVALAIRSASERATTPDREAAALREMIVYVDGAYARGELLNHEAPGFELLWSSEQGITSLADLRGKVVVVDFWATWCGPCVRSFPDLAKLQETYAGSPVVILGVTRVQGMHVGPKGQRVDTSGDPEREYELMAGYIGEQNITWPIGFIEDAVQIEYGVDSIPHVVIIDPDGVVRHRAIHAAVPLSQKRALIDPILAEFDLPVPGDG